MNLLIRGITYFYCCLLQITVFCAAARSCIFNTLGSLFSKTIIFASASAKYLMPLSVARFFQNIKANAAVEMALAFPILLLLSLTGFEMTRYIIIQQKISKTVSSMSDLVARLPSVSESQITNIFTATDDLMQPYTFAANGRVIISSVSNNGAATKVDWQRFGGGTLTQVSKIGTQGNNATLPAGFALASGEETIVAEVYYSYSPLVVPTTLGQTLVYKVKYNKPRLGALTTVKP